MPGIIYFDLVVTVLARCILVFGISQETAEAKLYKALDKLEAVISHDESDLSTWLPLEYDLQLTYGAENVRFSPWLSSLKEAVDVWTRRKIRDEKPSDPL